MERAWRGLEGAHGQVSCLGLSTESAASSFSWSWFTLTFKQFVLYLLEGSISSVFFKGCMYWTSFGAETALLCQLLDHYFSWLRNYTQFGSWLYYISGLFVLYCNRHNEEFCEFVSISYVWPHSQVCSLVADDILICDSVQRRKKCLFRNTWEWK